MTRAEFVVFVRAAKLGVVAAVDADRHPEAALVDLAVTDHGEVLFDTMAGARKVVSIGAIIGSRSSSDGPTGCRCRPSGAEVLLGAEREKYGRIHQEQVPKSRALREDFTLVKMVPTWLRYFDARPSLSASSRPLWSSALISRVPSGWKTCVLPPRLRYRWSNAWPC